MAKKKPTKAQSQRAHAKRRAEERYGLTLNRKDFEEVVQTIQRGGAKFLERQSRRVSIWKLVCQGTWIKVVYDNRRQTIASVLPMEDRSDDGNEEKQPAALAGHRD
jgi:hypothetical protein